MANKPNVLIVEDDAPIQLLLAAVVSRNGLQPVVAGDGTSAQALIAANDYAAIVLDLFIPETNGFELLRFVSCTRPELLPRILVVTAAAESTYRDCRYLDRVWNVLRKPFEVEVLRDELLACCEASGRAPRPSPHPLTNAAGDQKQRTL